MTIAERLREVRARIAAATTGLGRDPADIRLVAVSKFHPVESIRDALDAGQTTFGENYVQELVAKAPALPGAAFHFIGHLQKNKIKDVLKFAKCIETVDSIALAESIERRAQTPIDIFIQVNVAAEPQKSGCSTDELPRLLDTIAGFSKLRVRGLMTIPPQSDLPEASRPHFRALRELAGRNGLSELSMGMSADLEVAIEEGATLVRVGTAIFGPRAPKTDA